MQAAADDLHGVLRARFERAPDAPMLRLPIGGATSGAERVLSFAEVDRLAARFGAVLQDRGVRPGDRVVVQVAKSAAAVALYLGCVRIGAVFVPLNTAYTPAEVAHAVADAEPAAAVVDPARSVELAAALGPAAATSTLDARGGGTLGAAAEQAQGAEAVARAPEDLAAILYTSGTTGRPKGAMLTQANLVSNARALHALWGFRDGDVLLHALPIFHAHGLFVALHTSLINGSEMFFLERFDAERVCALLPRASVMMGVPTFYSRLLALPGFGPDTCRKVRLFTSGSAPLSAQAFDAFLQRTGHRILERYGMTETGMIASNPLDGERLAGSVGFALPGVEVRVVDDAGQPRAPGGVGEVEVRGPNVCAGYWRRAGHGSSGWRADGFFRTGDLGRLDADGRLWLVGRASDLIISGGYNVYPTEVETCLDRLETVAESAVVGLPHPDLGEAVVAFVVLQPGRALREDDLAEAFEGRLARFKQPKRILVVDALPRNALGKVEKAALRRERAGLFLEAPQG